MADVASTLRLWSATPGSNSPSGSTTIGSGLDDNLRQIQAVVRQFLASQGTNMSSGATVDLSTSDGFFVVVTGTTTTTALGTEAAGVWYLLRANGAWPLTYNATSLIILPHRESLTLQAGDLVLALSLGSGNWVVVPFTGLWNNPEDTAPATNADYIETYDASASAPKKVLLGRAAAATLSTEQASTSGTSIDFTGIPTWATRIDVMFVSVSTNGTSPLLLQVGDSGGVETSGYLGSGATLSAAAQDASNSTAGFAIGDNAGAAANIYHGCVSLFLEDASDNTWVCSGVLGISNAAQTYHVAGSKATSATLDRVRVTTVGGTDTFDAGVINVQWR